MSGSLPPRGARPRRRDFGKSSPLDKLPLKVRKALLRRCQSRATFPEIREWLKTAHGCETSLTALCCWNQRQQGSGQAGAIRTGQSFGGRLEIIIDAPGAREVRMRVRPIGGVEKGR